MLIFLNEIVLEKQNKLEGCTKTYKKEDEKKFRLVKNLDILEKEKELIVHDSYRMCNTCKKALKYLNRSLVKSIHFNLAIIFFNNLFHFIFFNLYKTNGKIKSMSFA